MYVFHDPKIIYIRVPATGSMSFLEGVNEPWNPDPKKGWPHYTAKQCKELVDPQIWNSYEKIAFVRHPFFWAQSIYKKRLPHFLTGIKTGGSFETYLQGLDKPPYFWFTDENGDIMVDTIYRTEDLADIFKKFNFSYKHINVARDRENREVVKTTEVEKLLQQKFSREFGHYDVNDPYGINIVQSLE